MSRDNGGSNNGKDSPDPKAGEGARLTVARWLRSPAGGPLAPTPDARAPGRLAEKGERRGEIAAQIDHAIAELLREHVGNTAVKVRTLVSGELVVVTLRDYLTRAERTLSDHGDGAVAMGARTALHDAIRPDATAAVEALTDRYVAAYLADQQTDPEIAVIVFVFDSPRGLRVA